MKKDKKEFKNLCKRVIGQENLYYLTSRHHKSTTIKTVGVCLKVNK